MICKVGRSMKSQSHASITQASQGAQVRCIQITVSVKGARHSWQLSVSTTGRLALPMLPIATRYLEPAAVHRAVLQ